MVHIDELQVITSLLDVKMLSADGLQLMGTDTCNSFLRVLIVCWTPYTLTVYFDPEDPQRGE